ncbi:hypothetical protein GOEFS_060_00360 [Gordonia effusa NBRC 100432]|uniref:Uncharacterized protein n=1 Tax=Gordonia effusa NBRC 100432 TaxID=1077974 RepID=H0R0P2_9ACTN|nr:hypothetical protein [Gordonia effusa]GAB18643.1 hypothetical protein GOEFS_060_00360 [Gordonia effusa NBRC 100432]
MIAPNTSREAAMRHRIDTMPGLSLVVDALDVSDIPRCLVLIAIACADVSGIGAEPDVADAFDQWRTGGRISESTMTALERRGSRAELEAGDPRLDRATRDIAFRRARALACLRFACVTGADESQLMLREVLRESAYEAAHAITTAGVVGVVRSFAVSDPG